MTSFPRARRPAPPPLPRLCSWSLVLTSGMEILHGSELKLSSKSMEVICCCIVRGLLPPRAAWLCAFPLFPFTLAFAFGAPRRWSRRAGTVAGIGCGGFTVPVRGLGEWLGVEALEAVMSGDRNPPLRVPGYCSGARARTNLVAVGCSSRVTTGEKWWDEEIFSEDSTSLICV
ncbi:hypothetical protein JB92DRAFT_3099519 [Gautieria morchelliformis]|nr:hypothetical protein JB92DRAFT_3099519 [Gautieria morchelliformis]